MVDELFLTDRTSLVEQEIFENSGFLPCQRQYLPGNRCGTRLCVEREIPAGENHVVLCE